MIHTGSRGLQGTVSGDSVSLDLSGAAGTFHSKDVGSGITVAISGLSLRWFGCRGLLADTAEHHGEHRTKKALTVTGITADDKVYDGGPGAAIDTGSAALQGTSAATR